MNRTVVYDTGALISADRNARATWLKHTHFLHTGRIPLVPAPVLAQASRSASQALLHRFLRGCQVVPLDERRAHRIGHLLAKTKTTDVVDACVVDLALERGGLVLTSDPDDLARLIAFTGATIPLMEV
jgi:predicted nucleic acid-binding protein